MTGGTQRNIGTGSASEWGQYYANASGAFTQYRHLSSDENMDNGVANTLYFDNHVKPLKLEDTSSDSTDAQWHAGTL